MQADSDSCIRKSSIIHWEKQHQNRWKQAGNSQTKTRDAAGTGFFREAWPSLGAWPTISVFPTVYSIRKKRQKRRKSGFFLICAADIYLFFVSFFVLFQFFQNWNDFKKGMRGKREGRMRMWIRFFIYCCQLPILFLCLFSVFSASSKIHISL